MFNFKTPIYAGIIGFFLIFITNFVKKNSLFVIFFRSFFYGILVCGLILGIYFILKKFLNIDFDNSNAKQDTDENIEEDEKANVDILIGKDDAGEDDENATFNANEVIGNVNVGTEDGVNPIDDFALKEDKINTSDNFDYSVDEVFHENKIAENNDDLIGDDNKEDTLEENKSNEFDDLSLDEDNFREKDDYNKKKSKEDILKKKIGVDVSYEDLAKAIRTKIKRDEQ